MISPFREVWVSLGKLRERIDELGDEEADALARVVVNEVAKAEEEWQIARRGPSTN